jgi:uncharacterized protein YecE (DUF72 family)
MPVVVGTSGWQYRDWRGPLYPPDLPQRDWLAYYAGRYATVENNSTFYRLPSRDTFADWQARIPADFVMTIKASRYLTHIRRLRDPEEPVAKLMAAAAGLGGRLGPVLLQLPPNLTADPGRLEACLAAFGRYHGTGPRAPDGPGRAAGIQVAVEPRHPSWWTEEVRQVLAGHGAALCWADQHGRPVTPLWRTAGWGYLRFHQGAAQPWPRYGPRALRSWMDRLAATWPDEATVYVYFNNDPGGAAVADSAAFAAACRRAGRTVTRTPGATATTAR